MRVFLSWSGPRSAALSRALRDWLPNVIQAVEPWMSESDIDKGARWSSEIAGELEAAHVGIICLSADNTVSPWLHFEAGALSKTLQKGLVCTYLLDLEPTDVPWPLAMFQATRANKEETRQLLLTLNKALGENAALLPERLDRAFERWWPELATHIEKASAPADSQKSRRSERELLEEILTLLRHRTSETSARLQSMLQAREDAAAKLREAEDRLKAVATRAEAFEGQAAPQDKRARAEREMIQAALGESIVRREHAFTELKAIDEQLRAWGEAHAS